jgi:hypothetical protein
MAGTVLEPQLTRRRAGRIQFDLAGPTDDAGIRRLLRENPMGGRISICLEREPNYFADESFPGELKQTIVARESGRIACMGSCVTRNRFVNGEVRRVGYLGGLRLDAACGGRFDILRRGYECFRELQESAPADFYFTSIASDNERAIRLLEHGVRGMPRYQFAAEFVTLLIPINRSRERKEAVGGKASRTAEDLQLRKALGFLNANNRNYQFAPCWSVEQLTAFEGLGLGQSDFCAIEDEAETIACAALWDQRRFKQTIIRGYAPELALARPVLNALTRFTNQPRLPAVGETLAHAFVTHLATRNQDPVILPLLNMIASLCTRAANRGIELLTLGFAAHDPRLATIRRHFRCRAYQSRIYVVSWPGIGGTARDLDERVLAPEVALL